MNDISHMEFCCKRAVYSAGFDQSVKYSKCTRNENIYIVVSKSFTLKFDVDNSKFHFNKIDQ